MPVGKSLSRVVIPFICTPFCIIISTPSATAQEAALPSITVTAQKREEDLSDVPISLVVINSEQINAININKIADLTEVVPNLTMTETGVSTQMYIRGIGSGNNQGFEQSVGQYVDGVYLGRQQLIRAPFFDLDRVEVLRGPQGTLFGKNSIAGALNLTTARPSEESEFEISALYEFESEQTEINAVASGALTDTFRARLALRTYQDNGYVQNTFRGTSEPERDEQAVRLTMAWDITPDLLATLKIERNNFDSKGRQIEIVRDDPNLFPAGSTPIAGLNLSQILQGFGQPAMDSILDLRRQANVAEHSDTTMDNITLNFDYSLGANTLTLTTGILEYDFNELCDCDYTPTSIFDVTLEEEYKQFSQEVRLSSPGGENFDWIVGTYYQDTEMNSREGINVPTDTLFNILAATSSNPSIQALANLSNTSAIRLNNQNSEIWAMFAQGTWSIRDNLRLTVGGRYTKEDKDASRRMDIIDTPSGEITTNPMAPLVYLGAFDVYSEQIAGIPIAPGVILPGHNLYGQRSEDSFTPMANLQWDVADNHMLYVSASTGFKAGGFDARANNPFSFEFQEEDANSIEIGSKSILADGKFEINLAAYFTDYENLQISQFDGTLGFNVGNAKSTEVKGLEVDGRWLTSEHTIVGYSYAWLDFEFKDFTNGNCYNRQIPDGDVVNGIPLCNYNGLSGKYTPEHSLTLFVDYHRPLTQTLNFVSNINLNYTDSQNVHDNLDPKFNIDSITRINMRVGIETQQWSLAFIGKNLTDEKVLTYTGNVPTSASMFGTNTFYGFVDRPRQLALEARMKF